MPRGGGGICTMKLCIYIYKNIYIYIYIFFFLGGGGGGHHKTELFFLNFINYLFIYIFFFWGGGGGRWVISINFRAFS